MAFTGFVFIALFGAAFILISLRRYDTRWLQRLGGLAIPLPWIAVELGWVLAEVGRQPWAIDGILPISLGASSLTRPELWATIAGFTLIYGALAVVEVGLIVRTVRIGPYAHVEDRFADAPQLHSPFSTPTALPAE